MSAALDSDSIKFLEEVKKGKPRRFILLIRGSSIQRLLIFKKGSAESLLQRVKKEGFKGQSYIGVVDGKGQDISFKLCAADGYDGAPGKEALLKAFLSSESGMTFKPTYEIVPELPQVDEGDDETAIATDGPSVASQADPVAELREKMRAAVQKLTPSIKEFVAANPQRRQEVLGPLALATDFAKGDAAIDASAAAKALKDMQTLLAESAKTQAAARSSRPAGELGRKIWDDSVQAVLDQVETLQKAIADHEDESYQQVAKEIMATVRKRFDGRLAEACQQFDAQADKDPKAVIGVIGEYAKWVKDDEMLKMLDDNPFDVKLSVRPTLAKALAEVERAVKSPAVKA